MAIPSREAAFEMTSNPDSRPSTGRNLNEFSTSSVSSGNRRIPESSQPLLETDTIKPERPTSGPEIDDLDEKPNKPPVHNPGVDDGFYYDNDPNTNRKPKSNTPGRGNSDRPGFIAPEMPEVPELGQGGRMPPDMNIYQQKKNFAQGMMDIALLTANASQLRYVLETGQTHPFYIVSIVLICVSLFFQVAVGIGLILMSRYNVKDYYDICSADRINNFCVIGVFLITITNVFIANFSVSVFKTDV